MPETDPKRPAQLRHTTGSKYEFQFGYSRAVRHGNVIRIAGTAGLGEDGMVVSDDVVEQMRRALQIIDPRILVEIEAEAVIDPAK